MKQTTKKPATKRPLTPEELAECARLKTAWGKWQEENRDKDGRKITQEKFAQENLGSTQANFGHYLHGRQALNIETLLALSAVFGVPPETISERLIGIITKAGFTQHQPAPLPQPGGWPFSAPWEVWDQLGDHKITVDKATSAMIYSLAPAQKKAANGSS